MRLEMDMRYGSGKCNGLLIPASVAESALEAMTKVMKKLEVRDQNLAESIGTICLLFSGGEIAASISADIVVFTPSASGLRSAKLVKCSAKFELGKDHPVEAFVEQILESIALASNQSRAMKRQPVAA